MRFRVLAVTILLVGVSIRSEAAYRVAMWVAPWDETSLTSIQRHGGNLTESNPVWYSLAGDGSVTTNWNAEAPSWRAAMVGTSLIPTIQNYVNGRFDPAVLNAILATPASREVHAEAIAQLAIRNAYDGIDLDYEAMPASSRQQFTAFVVLVGEKLHRLGKALSVTVHPKISDSQNWNGPGAQDWSAIGAIADSVKIMAYDYHWSTSEPGTLTPLSWLDKVAAYAEATIPASKIMIGLPWYGYDWSAGVGRGIGYEAAMNLLASSGATLERDADGEPHFSYAGGHVVYFQDAESYSRKVDLLLEKHPGIGGITHWRSGNEDPAIWNKVAALRGGASVATPVPPAVVPTVPPAASPASPPAVPPTVPPAGGGNPPSGSGAAPVVGDFFIDGPASLTVQEGGSITAQFGVISLNGFNSNVNVTVEALTPFPGTATLSVPMLASGSRVTLGLVSASGTAGSYQFRLRFASAAITHDQIITVDVKAPSRRRGARR